MAMQKIKIDELTDAIVDALEEYREDVTEGVKDSVKTVAKEPKMSDGLKVALAAGIGVVHDALVTLALMLFAGWLFNIEITAFFTAVFALIIVYSVYNAIVVFDRIRVNNDRYADLAGSAEVVDKSVKEAFKRIVPTSAAISAFQILVNVK